MKKILFVSYGGGHVNLLLPVFKQLVKKEDYCCEYLALTTAGNALKDNGFPYIGFKDLMEPGDEQVTAYGRELVGSEQASMVVPYNESVAYMGLSFWDLVQRYGETEAYRIYEEEGGRQAFYPITPLRRYLEKTRPDLVVTTNSPRAERAAIDAAGSLGIPAVCIIDLFALSDIDWTGQPGFANKVCVISEFVGKRLIQAGRSCEDIVVTGNPAFDSMAEVRQSDARQHLRQQKGWADDEQVVLWASNVEPKIHPNSKKQGDPELPRRVEAKLGELLGENQHIRVVFRSHPNDDYQPKDLPERVEISSSGDDLNKLLLAVDCVVVMSSTVGLQAALMNKPLVNIKLSIFSKGAPYDEMGLAIGVDDLDELNPAILQALVEGQAGTGLPEIGTATDKVVAVIENLLKDNSI